MLALGDSLSLVLGELLGEEDSDTEGELYNVSYLLHRTQIALDDLLCTFFSCAKVQSGYKKRKKIPAAGKEHLKTKRQDLVC